MDLVEVTANKALQGPARGSDLQGAELGQGTTFSFLLLPQRRPALGGRDHVIKKKAGFRLEAPVSGRFSKTFSPAVPAAVLTADNIRHSPARPHCCKAHSHPFIFPFVSKALSR